MEFLAHLDLEEQSKTSIRATIDGLGARGEQTFTEEQRIKLLKHDNYPKMDREPIIFDPQDIYMEKFISAEI